jgi:branched-chain amino acid transport system substrate-binding protein
LPIAIEEVESMSRERLAVVALAALSLIGASCGGTSGTTQQEFKLGIGGPYTGPVAKTGAEFQHAATMALEKINYKVGNYKITPVWVDEASDPAKASSALEDAIVGKNIQMGCLNWHSSDAVAMMPVANRHKVPYFFGMGATSVVNDNFNKDKPNVYWMSKGWPTPQKLATPYGDAIQAFIDGGSYTPKHGKTVAIWGEDTDWGHSLTGAIGDKFKSLGWSVVDSQFFKIDATDHHTILNKFKSEKPSIVAGTSTAPETMSAFVKQAKEVGLDSVIIADGLGYVGDFYKLVGGASDGVLDMQPLFASPAAQQFVSTYKSRFNSEPSPSAAGLAYDWTGFCLKILQRTLAKYGSLSSDNIYKVARDELWTGQLTYTDGIIMNEYKFTSDSIPDPVIGKGEYIFPVIQYKGGTGQIVFPPDVKQTNFTAPA